MFNPGAMAPWDMSQLGMQGLGGIQLPSMGGGSVFDTPAPAAAAAAPAQRSIWDQLLGQNYSTMGRGYGSGGGGSGSSGGSKSGGNNRGGYGSSRS